MPKILTTWFMDDLLQGVRNCFLTTFSLVYIFKIISMSQMKDKHARHSNGWYKFFKHFIDFKCVKIIEEKV